jgi:hypothetical protein
VRATLKSPLIFGFATILGALIWLLSLPLAGHREPWDAAPGYYPIALIVAGFLPACFAADRFWLSALGAWFGQLIGFAILLLRPDEPGSGASFWPLGLVFVCFYSLLSLFGAIIGAGVHKALRRLFSMQP